MSKNCPFCKKVIDSNTTVCPYCTRVLRETISIVNKTKSEQTYSRDINSKKKGINKNIKYIYNNKNKIYIILFFTLLFIIRMFIIKDNQYVSQKTPISSLNPIPVKTYGKYNDTDIKDIKNTKTKIRYPKDPKDYHSLLNGKILSSKSNYLNGLGKLRIINGTNFDAIAKLVNVSINKSIITVYIRADSTYSIENIKEGNYKLLFNLGYDWNSKRRTFQVNSVYEEFEDLFEYIVRTYREGDYLQKEVSNYEVTLNPVIGGNAKTKKVNALEFDNY